MESEDDAAELLRGHPDVAYVEAEREWYPATLGSDPQPPSHQSSAPWLKDVLGLEEIAPPANVVASGDEVRVAVVDTGLNYVHPYFESGLAVNAAEKNGVAGVDDDQNGYVDDIYGANTVRRDGSIGETATDHGTHVAGLVKAVRDQAAVHAADAARVKIVGVRFIDGGGAGSTSSAILALEYAAARGARVVNASWGARGETSYSQALYDAFLSLYERDVLAIVAAGNAEGGGSNDNDRLPYFPANFSIPGIVSVASVTPRYNRDGGYEGNGLSLFSNYGDETVHVAAPGSFLDAQGFDSGVYSANARFASANPLYIRKKGTSMAAPVVAGIAGVVRAINPRLTAFEVRELLIASSRPNGTPVVAGGPIDAMEAFRRARVEVSRGEKPPAEVRQFLRGGSEEVDGDEDSSPRDVGGCGSIAAAASHLPPPGPGNPLGGNSLGLVTILFMGLGAAKRSLRRLGRARV